MSGRDLSKVPAANLNGLKLENGWVVTAPLPQKSSSGGTFSFFYEVRNGDREGFLKAIDFTEAFEPGADTIKMLAALTAGFELERDIVFLCAKRRLSKVVIGIDHGSVHPRGVGGLQQYQLTRYTSQLTRICMRYEIELRMKKAG